MAAKKRDVNDDLNRRDVDDAPDENRDAITGAPGSHPIGTGVGAAGGGAAGAAIGAVISGPAAPVGAVVGAVIGAVAGGLAGKGAAEAVNRTAENAYWQQNYNRRPYYTQGLTYEDYQPAYRYGWESQGLFSGRRFNEMEDQLAVDWDKVRSKSRLTWDQARHAARDAWERVENPDTGRGVSTPATQLRSQQPHPGTDYEREAATGTTSFDAGVNEFVDTECRRYAGREFDDVENDLMRDWDSRRTGSTWDRVKDSVRRAWHKV